MFFQVVHFRFKWLSYNEIESDLFLNSETIATAIVNFDRQTVDVISGGFAPIAENPLLLKRFNKTHQQYWLDAVKEHALGWATRDKEDV